MYIAEIIYPGTWLDINDRDIAFELQIMLYHLEDCVAEAAITLTMFEASKNTRGNSRGEWERHEQIRREVDAELRAERGDLSYHNFKKFHLECERRALKRKHDLRMVPRTYSHKIPFIHAHSFVFAIDKFGKFLDELCAYEVLPNAVSAIRDEFNDKLPMVRKIRNSALHLEDRTRRYASVQHKKKKQRMEIQGFLGLSILEGDNLCYTIDDGSYQKIAVTHETLSILVETINKLLCALPWKGPPRVAPG